VIDVPPEPVTHGPNFWVVAAVVLVIVGSAVGLALQLGSWKSERADQAAQERARASDEGNPPAETHPQAAPTPAPSPPRAADLPAYGEYVYVEELPEALERVAPEYPDAARETNLSGTVVVQALIGRDGLVKDTKVVNSIPGLDDAAVKAVAQWTFKPAKAKGQPVAVWVAVPVKFSLN
jgi:TonB family protein